VGLLDIAAQSLRPFSFRGKGRLLNSLCEKTGTRRTTLFGYQIDLSLDDHIQRNVYLGTYEQHDSALVRRYLRPGMTFVDVGANIGFYSLMAAEVAGPSGRVIAFEPNPDVHQHLQETIRNNGIQNIILEQAAVGDAAGWTDLFVPKESGNNTATMIANEGGRPVRVPVVTLDEYLDRHQVARVDFLKIDAEGFEPKVIQGARSAIQAKRIGAMFCEFNGTWLRLGGTTPKDYYNQLRSLGLKPTQEQSDQSLENNNILFVAG
jgi:FkbM family methyltransferase